VSDTGREGGTDEKIPGRNDFHGATDQAVPVNNKEALLRFCLEIRMEKPTKQILSYWKLRDIM
jgi:hypothetical protein